MQNIFKLFEILEYLFHKKILSNPEFLYAVNFLTSTFFKGKNIK